MTALLSVTLVRLPHGASLPLPHYASGQAAGMDLRAAVDETMLLPPGGRLVTPTGFAIALPPGWEAQIRSRSGLAANNGVVVLNSPGTIDADYRGEIKVVLANFGDAPFVVNHGMRIAQMVVAPVANVQWVEAAALPETDRGEDGFGSTGF